MPWNGGAEQGLKFIQLDGNVGVAGERRRAHHDDDGRHQPLRRRPANFLEIGGEAYTKSEAALKLVLANPGVKSLVVNFCVLSPAPM